MQKSKLATREIENRRQFRTDGISKTEDPEPRTILWDSVETFARVPCKRNHKTYFVVSKPKRLFRKLALIPAAKNSAAGKPTISRRRKSLS